MVATLCRGWSERQNMVLNHVLKVIGIGHGICVIGTYSRYALDAGCGSRTSREAGKHFAG